MFRLYPNLISCLLKSLTKIILLFLISLKSCDSQNKSVSSLGILHCHHQWLVSGILLLTLVVFHDKHTKFLQGQWELEQLDISQVVILNHDISELRCNFNFFSFNQRIACPDDSLLHIFGQTNTFV